MPLAEILALPIVAFLAFLLKGIAGIGVSTVAVPILSLIIGAKQIVVLSSIVNVIGGLVMYRIDPQPASRRYWWPIAALMIIGRDCDPGRRNLVHYLARKTEIPVFSGTDAAKGVC
jgi:uncharacterized membrane protein YfcA